MIMIDIRLASLESRISNMNEASNEQKVQVFDPSHILYILFNANEMGFFRPQTTRITSSF